MKDKIIGISLLAAALGVMLWQGTQKPAPAPIPAPSAQTANAQVSAPSTPSTGANAEAGEATQASWAQPSVVKKAVMEAVEATQNIEGDAADVPAGTPQTIVLENEFLRVTFTQRGGGIAQIDMIEIAPDGELRYSETVEGTAPFHFNKGAKQSALALAWGTQSGGLPEAFLPNFEVLSQTATTVQFRLQTAQGIEVIRGYRLRPADGSAGDPYVIDHQTRFTNQSEQSFSLSRLFVNAGTLPTTEGDVYGQYLNFATLDGLSGDVDFTDVGNFKDSSGIAGIGARAAKAFVQLPENGSTGTPRFRWGAVKNQFFSGILIPTVPATQALVTAGTVETSTGEVDLGMTGHLGFDLGELPAGAFTKLQLAYYVGPMEYHRLEALGGSQTRLMQFGWQPFRTVASLLLLAMSAIHSAVAHVSPDWAWGWAIVLITAFIKLALWPLTAMQIKSSRRMQRLSGPMKAIREKHKSNPQKGQQEMMKLFQEHKVNPAAGCLPLLVQMPIFIGLFFMLRSASELRFAEFLWVSDLAVPDTIPGLPEYIHILPILMGISMYFQMQLMPTPTTDGMQTKLLKFMPFIFLIFCYKFPAGLTLYWTLQNVFTILQTWVMRDKNPLPANGAPIEVEATPVKGKSKRKGKGNK